MTYDKKYIKDGDFVGDYLNDREDRIEEEFSVLSGMINNIEISQATNVYGGWEMIDPPTAVKINNRFVIYFGAVRGGERGKNINTLPEGFRPKTTVEGVTSRGNYVNVFQSGGTIIGGTYTGSNTQGFVVMFTV